ncbi:hypothetical protein [Shouchella lonarensis]|uniref:Yip1 domain-containing protein n=1 Tax=Shouchella lonarensis TaxID=1464122 RepID=A0A1G6GV02_9BACI|nr:hypothetical protein [Shouchella lonarensis]SDB85525.1 hypothetical protein SAMN05421737_10225 [Shouchella lonarensis]
MNTEKQQSEMKVDLQEMNPFIVSNKKPNKSILTRMAVYAIVMCVLSVIVSIRVPIDQLFSNLPLTDVGEGKELFEQLDAVSQDERMQRFITVSQGLLSFFSPIFVILLTAVGLKIFTLIFRKLFKTSFKMQQLLVVATVSYAVVFISNVLRSSFSIFSGEFLMYSLGSLAHYVESLQLVAFPLNVVGNIDFFMLLFCGLLGWGLHTFSKARLKSAVMSVLAVYLMGIIAFSFLLGN